MKVRIIKSTPDRWYNDQIGMIINVVDKGETYFGFSAFATLYIHKSDCEILPEENQPEPFDLERALRGEKVIGCSGDEGVFIFTNHNSFDGDKHLFQFSVKNSGDQYVLVFNGTGWQGGFTGIKHDSSIFMAPRESEYVTKWVNVYEDNGNIVIGKRPFCSFSIAKDVGTDPKESSKYIATSPITFKRPL